MATTTGPLAVPAFRRLWLARFISNIGNGLAPTALAFGVLDLPGASADDLGFVLAAAAVPLVVFMPLGGVIADRLPRALVISTTDIVLSVLVAVQGLLLITGDATIGSLALLNVGAGFLNALWFPAFPGLVPGVLPEDQLQRGNGQIAIASNLGLIVGSAAAGALVVAFGAGVAILLDGITFLAAGVLVFTLRHATPATPSGESMLRDLRDGWRTFLSFRWLWVVVAAFAFFNAVVRGGLEVGGPVLMREAFDGPSSWAALQTANAIGFLVGAIVGTRMRVTRPLVMHQLAGMAIPLYLAALAVAAPMPVLLVLSFGVGVSLDVCYVLWSTSVQTHVPRASLSRASAFDAMGSVAFGPVGLAIAGPAVERLGLGGFFAASTALTVTSLVIPLLVRDVRDLRWRDPDPEVS